MNIQNVPLGECYPSALNPRTTVDPAAIEALADEIGDDGLLQNLVGRRDVKVESVAVEIIAGCRRLAALRILAKRDPQAFAAFEVPVKIVEADDLEALRLATIENVNQETMHPLDEAAAFKRLVQGGVETDHIARSCAKTRRFVQLRLQLEDNLAPTVKKAYRDGKIDLSRARVIAAMAPKKEQATIVTNIERGDWSSRSAENLAEMLGRGGGYPNFDMALFDIAAYNGEVCETDHSELAVDKAQFARLQLDAVEALKKEIEGKNQWGFVDLLFDGGPHDQGSGYRQVHADRDDKKTAGVVIYGPRDGLGRFTVREWLRRGQTEEEKAAAAAAAPAGAAPAKPVDPLKALPGKPGADLAAIGKTDALRVAILAAEPAPAITAVMLALMTHGYKTREIRVGRDVSEYAGQIPSPHVKAIFDKYRPTFKGLLDTDHSGDKLGFQIASHVIDGITKAYKVLTAMPAVDRAELLKALVARDLGTWPDQTLGNSPWISALAEDIGAEPRLAVDKDYLATLTAPGLVVLAHQLGVEGEDLRAFSRRKVKTMRLQLVNAAKLQPDYVPLPVRFGTKADLEKATKAAHKAAYAEIEKATKAAKKPAAKPAAKKPAAKKPAAGK